MNDASAPILAGRCTRRRFLRASLGSTALVTGSILAGTTLRSGAPASPVDRLVSLFPAASAAVIGRAYLGTRPDVVDLDGIVAALRQKLPALAMPDRASDRRLRTLLDARTRADLGDGDVVRVDGWILARTEALLCAYVALRLDGASR